MIKKTSIPTTAFYFTQCYRLHGQYSHHLEQGKADYGLAIGNSGLNYANQANLGFITLHFNNDNHEAVAIYQIPSEEVDSTLKNIVTYIHEKNHSPAWNW